MSGQIEEFQSRNCRVLGVSTDSIETHEKWLKTPRSESGLGTISFPLASDIDGKLCEKYGVYDQRQKTALRGLFIIDPNGVLQYHVTQNLNVGRNTDEVLRVLDAVQKGGLCPADRTVADQIHLHDALQTNHVVGNYRIKSKLGSGAFGSVFLAEDMLLQRPVALKVLKTGDHRHRIALINEARNAAALNHPNVCAIHSIDQSHGDGMIVMEFVEGQTLMERLTKEKFDEKLTAQILSQVASGMSEAHKAGIVHGDLKPANIMLTQDNTAKVMDFGLARKALGESLETETVIRELGSINSTSGSAGLTGTPGYMAPEITQGQEASAASDVFALGLIAYEMLTGKAAIKGNNILEVIRAIDAIDPDQLSAEVPLPFAKVVRESLLGSAELRGITMRNIADLANAI